MNELIKIETNENGQVVSAKELYNFLGLNKSQWSRWSKMNIEDNVFFENNVDYTGFDIVSSGNKTKDYAITLEMAKHLAMLTNNRKGKEIRGYFIECEKNKPKQLTTLQVLKLATKEIEKLSQKLEVVTERKNEVTAVLETMQTYGDNILFRDFVKIIYQENKIEISEKEFRNLLVNERYIDKKYFPFAKYKKYFNVNRGIKNGHVWHTTRLTAKGQLYFCNKLIKMMEEK